MIGTIPLSEVLIVSGALFCIGLCGALLRRNAIQIFLSIELMMNSANLAILGYGASLGTREGQIVVFFVIAIAAAEAAVASRSSSPCSGTPKRSTSTGSTC